MYKVNQSENLLTRIEQRCFSELKLQERPYLQEWFEQTPETLGEDLLVIQKESEEKSTQDGQKLLHQIRRTFWTKMLEVLHARSIARYANISPSKDHWLSSATGVSGCSLIVTNPER